MPKSKRIQNISKMINYTKTTTRSLIMEEISRQKNMKVVSNFSHFETTAKLETNLIFFLYIIFVLLAMNPENQYYCEHKTKARVRPKKTSLLGGRTADL